MRFQIYIKITVLWVVGLSFKLNRSLPVRLLENCAFAIRKLKKKNLKNGIKSLPNTSIASTNRDEALDKEYMRRLKRI